MPAKKRDDADDEMSKGKKRTEDRSQAEQTHGATLGSGNASTTGMPGTSNIKGG